MWRSLLRTQHAVLGGLMLSLLPSLASASDSEVEAAVGAAPTSLKAVVLRGGQGAYGANRGSKRHAGVDLVAIRADTDKEVFAVMATGTGTVAYAQMNGTETTGYGFTVVIDHQNGVYTQYSHLATSLSQGLVKVGDTVFTGKVIGYMGDPAKGVVSSGNIHSDVVAKHHKIQLHFEVFRAPTGALSAGLIKDLKRTTDPVDPTARLKVFGYK